MRAKIKSDCKTCIETRHVRTITEQPIKWSFEKLCKLLTSYCGLVLVMGTYILTSWDIKIESYIPHQVCSVFQITNVCLWTLLSTAINTQLLKDIISVSTMDCREFSRSKSQPDAKAIKDFQMVGVNHFHPSTMGQNHCSLFPVSRYLE